MSTDERHKRHGAAMMTNLTPEAYWASLMQTGGRLMANEHVRAYADRQRAAGDYLGALFDVATRVTNDDGKINLDHAAYVSRHDVGITHGDMIENLYGQPDPRVQGMRATIETLTEVVHDLGYVDDKH